MSVTFLRRDFRGHERVFRALLHGLWHVPFFDPTPTPIYSSTRIEGTHTCTPSMVTLGKTTPMYHPPLRSLRDTNITGDDLVY